MKTLFICPNEFHDLFLKASNDLSSEVLTEVVYWTAYVWLNWLIFLEKAVVGAVWGRQFWVKTTNLYVGQSGLKFNSFSVLNPD